MIILQPNRELKREVIEADEIKLSKKLNDLNDDVVIIPSCYDIVSMDDACELVEVVARESNTLDTTESMTEKMANEELHDLARKNKNDESELLIYIPKEMKIQGALGRLNG